MVQKINNTMFVGNGPIKILYPGLAISKTDTGIGSIGRIDHPEFYGNTVIKMHPHINDEILSYFRTGKAEHKDSEGFVGNIGKNKLMLMKAGKLFYHEEKIFGGEELFEGLQIFIRPGKKDLKPEVHFLELDDHHSKNKWRLLASPSDKTKLRFSSQTWIYDMKLLENNKTFLPELPQEGLTYLLYVFKGKATINTNIELVKKESLVIKGDKITIIANEDTELVLFITDEEAEIFKEGMYSGNQASY
jgi:redox-sensitive bicupin YhaK (pirin superfamily)